MNDYYQIIEDLEADHYRRYFLNEFIPLAFQDQTTSGTKYGTFRRNSFTPTILDLEKTLQDVYSFPTIEYFLIFVHRKSQPVHVDGHSFVRLASLNLTLSGYEGTQMNYYNILKDVRNNTDAQYFNSQNVQFREAFAASPKWVLVNSGEPHNISGINPEEPRMTVCFRFTGNPPYRELLLKSQKKWATE